MSNARVRRIGDEKRHYWLALGMAQVSGTDLQRALDEGRITHGDWADVVTRCRACSWAESCRCWMAMQTPGSPADVPRACPNAGLFDAVRAGETAPSGAAQSD